MSSNFECFVQINDNKYNISIDQYIVSTSFESIYPKIKEIVKIAENVDIDLKTHDFEVCFSVTNLSIVLSLKRNNFIEQNVENECLHKKQLHRLSQIIKSKSIINITPKLIHGLQSNDLRLKIVGQLPEDNNLLMNESEIRKYHSIVMAIDVNDPHNDTQSLCGKSENWLKFFKRVQTIYGNTSFSSARQIRSIYNRWTQYYAEV